MRELWEGIRRRADGPAEVVADLIRLIGAICIPIAAIGWGPLGGVSLAFATGGMVVPRALRVRPGLDIAFGIVTLIAVWSSVTDLYVTVKWWDLPVHFALNALVAAMGYLLLVHFRIVADAATLPRPTLSTAVVTTALGISFGVFWEMFEWFGKNFIDDEIYVGYTDSIGDLLWGGIGSLLAGLAMPWLAARPGRRAPDAAASRDSGAGPGSEPVSRA
ncbi:MULTISPECIES: hypothetical protein [unclassified Agromyces]|uniref:hypothetical protein n=1 Tax=unclassified Agromyces TaxID=2639701 RepID=UPI00301454EB